jgi:hypothetical protein
MTSRIELGVLMHSFLTKYDLAEDSLAAIQLNIIVNKAEQAALAEVRQRMGFDLTLEP